LLALFLRKPFIAINLPKHRITIKKM